MYQCVSVPSTHTHTHTHTHAHTHTHTQLQTFRALGLSLHLRPTICLRRRLAYQQPLGRHFVFQYSNFFSNFFLASGSLTHTHTHMNTYMCAVWQSSLQASILFYFLAFSPLPFDSLRARMYSSTHAHTHTHTHTHTEEGEGQGGGKELEEKNQMVLPRIDVSTRYTHICPT